MRPLGAQFKNWINLNAFVRLPEHRNFPEVNLVMSARFERWLTQGKNKVYLEFCTGSHSLGLGSAVLLWDPWVYAHIPHSRV